MASARRPGRAEGCDSQHVSCSLKWGQTESGCTAMSVVRSPSDRVSGPVVGSGWSAP